MTTSNAKGYTAELKAQLRAAELGMSIAIPTSNYRYDLILGNGKKFYRVQVKYANGTPSHASGSVVVQLTYATRTKKYFTYSADEVDALVVYIPKIDRLCWFPIEVFAGKKALCVRIEPSLNGQITGVNLASDYYW